LLLLKNLLFTLIVPGTVAVYVPILIARRLSLASCAGSALVFAGTVIAAGAGVYARCVWDFAAFGRGTPAPIDAPGRLVVRGLYRYARNPMYAGVIAVIAGWAILFQSAALASYGLFVALGFHGFVVFYEEPHLRRRFGRQYEDYAASVGRWLPRWPRR
jgi:protein-S-isoprenylcysteine O-methyltransferase Ste14